MENRIYAKIIIAVVAIAVLCVIAGALIPGSPIKPLIDQTAGGIAGNGEQKTPTATPSVTAHAPTALPYDSTSQGVGTTIQKAVDLARNDPIASSWLSSHGGWGISQMQADHMDAHGQASGWTITYVDGADVMLVNIQDGEVISSNYYTSGSSVLLGMKLDGLVDSTSIMETLMSNCSGLKVNEGSKPFSMSFSPEADGRYIVYYWGTGQQPSFSATFNARTGELLENTYRGAGE